MSCLKRSNIIINKINKDELLFVFIWIIFTFAIVYGLQFALIPFGNINAPFYSIFKIFTQIVPIIMLFIFQQLFSKVFGKNIRLPTFDFIHKRHITTEDQNSQNEQIETIQSNQINDRKKVEIDQHEQNNNHQVKETEIGIQIDQPKEQMKEKETQKEITENIEQTIVEYIQPDSKDESIGKGWIATSYVNDYDFWNDFLLNIFQ